MPNFSSLAGLEVVEKFVLGGVELKLAGGTFDRRATVRKSRRLKVDFTSFYCLTLTPNNLIHFPARIMHRNVDNITVFNCI